MMIDVLQLERGMGHRMCGQRWNKPWRWAAPNLGAIRYLLSVDCRQNNTLTPEVEVHALRRHDGRCPAWKPMNSCGQLAVATEVVQ